MGEGKSTTKIMSFQENIFKEKEYKVSLDGKRKMLLTLTSEDLMIRVDSKGLVF